jgi:hypothetical protein
MALPAYGASGADVEAVTIRLVSVTTNAKWLVDRAPKRVSNPGDVVWLRSTLRNERPQFGKPKGAVVGSDVATVKIVSRSTVDLKVTVRLPGGTLRASRRIREGDSKPTIRVTGGTGTFANARGTGVSSSVGPSGARALNVYRLLLP